MRALSASSKLSHEVIRSLYDAIAWYCNHPGAGKAGVILNHYKLWKNLHYLTVNISEEGWKALKELAKTLGITSKSRKEKEVCKEEEMLLFAIETYLHLFTRALALVKLGISANNIHSFIKNIGSQRNVFPASPLEWFFEAVNDPSLPQNTMSSLVQSINAMLTVLDNLNIATLTTDVFRDIYQNIIPQEIRRSLGEFYTKEDIVDEVLDAAKLDHQAIESLYKKWKQGEKPVILDPACGSGSFLIRVINRIFDALGCKPDIASFVEDVVVGIDINILAVEMTRLNIILTLAGKMFEKCKSTYVPQKIRVFWADSLAKLSNFIDVVGRSSIRISVPSLAQIVGETEVRIPIIPGIDVDCLIDLAVEYAESNRNEEEFLGELISRVGYELVKDRRNELKMLFNVIKGITEKGNSRVVELIKNTAIVSNLIGRCDYVIGNPPWVRIHRVAPHIMKFLRDNYKYFKKGSAYDPKFKKTKTPFKEQYDYSIAFVERGLDFLREGGVLSYVITSKITKAMYAGAMREDLVKNYTILEIRDYSLYPRPLFQDAVNYPLIFSAKKARPLANHQVSVTVVNTAGDKKSFTIPQAELSMYKDDLKSPWLLAPKIVIDAYRKISSNSSRFGDLYEVSRGVMTSVDDLYEVKLISCLENGLVNVEVNVKQGTTKITKNISIEGHLIHPFVRGEDIDPFNYSFDRYVIFTHDTSSFDPLWDQDQKLVLSYLGLLNQQLDVRASGSTLVYTLNAGRCDSLSSSLRKLSNLGFTITPVQPCAVSECYSILKGKDILLKINLRKANDSCEVYVEGLRLPGAARATQYFISYLDSLVKRDDYRANMPPWAIFRVSRDKFKEYRIAWQEIAKYFEACHLPVWITGNVCGKEKKLLVVPKPKVYFIVEPDKVKALKLLLYLNSDLARALIKLWSRVLRGGYYEHTSTHVGLLPLPLQLLNSSLWPWLKDHVKDSEGKDLNEIGREIYRKRELIEKLLEELLKALGITHEEYEELINYGKWLNETTPVKEVPGEIEEEEIEE